MMSRSRRIRVSMPACWTLTATACPVRSRARWTWPGAAQPVGQPVAGQDAEDLQEPAGVALDPRDRFQEHRSASGLIAVGTAEGYTDATWKDHHLGQSQRWSRPTTWTIAFLGGWRLT